jgi:multiple sugar transport system permease protein
MVKPKYYGIRQIFFFYIPMLFLLFFVLFPLYWTVVISLRHPGDVFKFPVEFLPNPATLQNFVTAWVNVGFNIYFQNSLIVAVCCVVLVTFFSIFTGYALSRFKFKGKNVFMFMMLSTQFIPAAMLIIPLFIIFRNMNLLNNLISLVIINTTMQLSFNSILMRGFVSGIPYELEEAAIIDGCTRVGAIFRTVIPILLPGIVATAAFAFVGVWNELPCGFVPIGLPKPGLVFPEHGMNCFMPLKP